MKRSLRGLIASCACFLPFAAAPAAEAPLKVERVVMLMRHGVRPPIKLQPVPAEYSPMPWPKWDTAPGRLTHHGAKGIALLAAADRAQFVSEGLLPAEGCPASGQVTVIASNVPRAIETAEAWTTSLARNCGVVVQHPAKGGPDLLFHILETKPSWFDGHLAYESAIAQAPKGGLETQAKMLAPEMQRIGAVLGCARPACPLETEPTTLIEKPHDAPDFRGPLDAASTASETFLLEYLEGKPPSGVGWGRIDRSEIGRLLIFNVTKFKYTNRPPYIAKGTAGPLARAIVKALTAPAGSRITLLAGHDTNIADLGGLLGLHWQVTGDVADDIPPGSALGFELVSDGQRRQFVRAFFRSQTMDQLRNLQSLTGNKGPYREHLDIPGCGRATAAFSCDLRMFVKVVEARLR